MLKVKDLVKIWATDDAFRISHYIWQDGDCVGERVYFEGNAGEIPDELLELEIRFAAQCICDKFDVCIELVLEDDSSVKDRMENTFVLFEK